MKYQTITLVIMGSIFSIISMSAITLPENMAEARLCYWQDNPYPGLPDELQCFDNPISLPIPPSFCPECSELNPQPLPPIDCPMCGAFVLDKSLFEIASEVKITPQEDGSIVINAVMLNNTNNLDSANMTNQQ